MQICRVKMAPEQRVIMCESNNPVRNVRQEPVNTKKAPALNSRVLETRRQARCGRISTRENSSFCCNLSDLVQSRALDSLRAALRAPPEFPLTSDFLPLVFSLKRRDSSVSLLHLDRLSDYYFLDQVVL